MATGSREVWAERVARWKASGLSAEEFARRHKVSEASLKWWKWKLGSSSKKEAMSPLTFVEMTAPMRREALELVIGDVIVRVPSDFDDAALEIVQPRLDLGHVFASDRCAISRQRQTIAAITFPHHEGAS